MNVHKIQTAHFIKRAKANRSYITRRKSLVIFLVKIVLDPFFAISIVGSSYHYRRRLEFTRERERKRDEGRILITSVAINESERLYNQRADIYCGANVHSPPDADYNLILLSFNDRVRRDQKAPWQTVCLKKSVILESSQSLFCEKIKIVVKIVPNVIAVNSVMTNATDFIIV